MTWGLFLSWVILIGFLPAFAYVSGVIEKRTLYPWRHPPYGPPPSF